MVTELLVSILGMFHFICLNKDNKFAYENENNIPFTLVNDVESHNIYDEWDKLIMLLITTFYFGLLKPTAATNYKWNHNITRK